MTDSRSGQAAAAGLRRGKRERLIAAATQLLHQQGTERTTLADIAEAADVPVGGVYYYFKTKDDVIAAVIEAHVQQIKTTLASIDTRHRSPKSRLKAFVREFAAQSEIVAQYGCPLGSLCSELDKRVKELRLPVTELMRLPIGWAEDQFRSLEQGDARDLAFDLLAAYEGSALLANTMHDPDVLTRAARRIDHWIDTLLPGSATTRAPVGFSLSMELGHLLLRPQPAAEAESATRMRAPLQTLTASRRALARSSLPWMLL